MTVSQTKVVDAISLSKDGAAVLTISDHLDWDDDDHVLVLQNKVNSYLAFIESGELIDTYPAATGRRVEIDVVFLHYPSALGIEFLNRASDVVREAGFSLSYRMLPDA